MPDAAVVEHRLAPRSAVSTTRTAPRRIAARPTYATGSPNASSSIRERLSRTSRTIRFWLAAAGQPGGRSSARWRRAHPIRCPSRLGPHRSRRAKRHPARRGVRRTLRALRPVLGVALPSAAPQAVGAYFETWRGRDRGRAPRPAPESGSTRCVHHPHPKRRRPREAHRQSDAVVGRYRGARSPTTNSTHPAV